MTERTPADRPGQLPSGDVGALTVALAEHPFTEGFDAAHLGALADIAGEVAVPAGQYVFRQGQPAGTLYLITGGDVALEIALPAGEPLILETLHDGDALGWSWLYPPYQWHLDARTTTDVTALTVDAVLLRQLFTADTAFGLEVTWRIGAIVVDRLHHARRQLTSVQLP